MEYRFYSFVAGGYISALQAGLQTAHAVSEMSVDQEVQFCLKPAGDVYKKWAEIDKTIIICNAFNHAGVEAAFEEFSYFANELDLPCVIFHEDEQSLNGVATATAIIVPEIYYNAKYAAKEDSGEFEDAYVWLPFHHSPIDWSRVRGSNPPNQVESLRTSPEVKRFVGASQGRPATVEFEFIKFLKSFQLYR